jgi:uncharacterized membrane protein
MQIVTDESGEDVRPLRSGRGVSVALWTVQGLLAALFLFAGAMKFVMPLEQMTKGTSLPGPFFWFIGVVELLGAIGLIVPAVLRIRPILTPVAACGLVIVMAGATVLSLPMGAAALFPLVTGVLAAFVAYGRFRLRPIYSRT